MKNRPIVSILVLAALSITSAFAVVLIGPTNFATANPGFGANIITAGTITDSQLPAGANKLIITYSVTRADSAAGTNDSWLAFVANGNNSVGDSSFVTTGHDFGLLLRSTNYVHAGGHQPFGLSNGTTAANTPFSSAGASVRIEIDLTNKLSGVGNNLKFMIDEGSSSFVTADKTLQGTFGWDLTAGTAVFAFGANGYTHSISNFTVEAIPEPSAAALLGLGAIAILRRRR